MKLQGFLNRHAVFTHDEFVTAVKGENSHNPNTQKALLAYYKNSGRILPLRRGLYAVVPPESTAKTLFPDPYLVAGKMAEDAVLAYHTALDFHGQGHSVYHQFVCCTESVIRLLEFRKERYCGVPFPKALLEKKKQFVEVERHNRGGVEIRVTSLERTLVDVFDRPSLAGSWEEIWNSLEDIEFLNLDKVIQYVKLLDNATTAAKVGFFLEQNREHFKVDDKILKRLRKLRPQKPHYMVRGNRRLGHFIADWNLVVPEDVYTKNWNDLA